MKFRPRIQLQVRSIEQYDRMKALAADSPSVNEWILRVLESSFPSVREVEPEAPVRIVKPKEKK